MVLPNVSYTIEPQGQSVAGYTFWVEGDAVNGITPIRTQFENGRFVVDQAGQSFVSGKEYRFLGSHPTAMPDAQLLRVVWDEQGVAKALTDGESADRNSGFAPTLQQVTQSGNSTTIQVNLQGGIKAAIPDAPVNLPALVIDPITGIFYKAPSSALPVVLPVLGFANHYELKPDAANPPFTVPAGTPVLIAGNYSASLDEGSCDRVGGWAAKRDSLNTIVSVDIYLGAVKITTVVANELRTDVASAIGSTSNTFFGFSYVVPPTYRSGVALVWSAKIAGTNTELTFSPRTSNVCTIATPTVINQYITGPDTLNEGGTPGQFAVMQQSAGVTTSVRPDSWTTDSVPAGVTINSNGLLTPGIGQTTIPNTITFDVKAQIGSIVLRKSVQIVKSISTNSPPTVVRFPDTSITATGVQTLNVSSVFTDTDVLTWSAVAWNNAALPAGITFNATTKILSIAADYPNGSLVIRLKVVDTGNNQAQSEFLLFVNRPVAPSITVVSTQIVGANFINEGATLQYTLRRTFSDGSFTDMTSQATKALEGWLPGENIDNAGFVSIPLNAVQGDGHELIVVMNLSGVRYTKSIRVEDTSPAVVAPSINRIALFHPIGWRAITFNGSVSQNLHILVRVAGTLGTGKVQAKYNQSRSDPGYRVMQPINYANNPSSHPAGYTHWTDINDEDFTNITRSLNEFFVQIRNAPATTIQRNALPGTSTPDLTTTQLYTAP